MCETGVCVQVRKARFEDQTKPLFLRFGQWVNIFEEIPKSIRDVIGDVLCRQVLFQQGELRISWRFVSTPRFLYGSGKCGAWFFVHRVPFCVTWARKDDKNRRNKKSLVKKKRFCCPRYNCSLLSHFNQPNIERKIGEWTMRYKRLLEMCNVQQIEMKSVFTVQTKKRLVSRTVKSAKHGATFWKLLSTTKNRKLCCLAAMAHFAVKKTSRDYEN